MTLETFIEIIKRKLAITAPELHAWSTDLRSGWGEKSKSRQERTETASKLLIGVLLTEALNAIVESYQIIGFRGGSGALFLLLLSSDISSSCHLSIRMRGNNKVI